MLPTPTTRTRTSPMLHSPLASIAFRRIIACGRTAGNRPGGKRLASEERGLTPRLDRPRVRSDSRAPGSKRLSTAWVRSGSRGCEFRQVRAAWVRSVSSAPGLGRLSTGLGSGFGRLRLWLGFVRSSRGLRVRLALAVPTSPRGAATTSACRAQHASAPSGRSAPLHQLASHAHYGRKRPRAAIARSGWASPDWLGNGGPTPFRPATGPNPAPTGQSCTGHGGFLAGWERGLPARGFGRFRASQ